MNKQKEFIEMDMEYPRSDVTHVYQIDKDEHHKTYAEDFFEKFPNAESRYYDHRGKAGMIPIPCRQHCYGVIGQKCNGIGCSCSNCWAEEMEDEE